jgi:molybdate transport system substrate-binding protein
MLMRALRDAIRLAVLPIVLAAFIVTTWSLEAWAQTFDIRVFAGASLKNALDEANAFFLYDNGFNVIVTYGASPALARRIESGEPADVFISADLDSMAYLEQRGLVQPDMRDTLVANKLVLIAGANSNLALTIGPKLALAEALGNGRLAMGDPNSVAAGKYAKAALEGLGVWGEIEGKIAPAADTRAAVLLVSSGQAPLGIVFASDAATDKTVKVIGTFPESTHPLIVYPMGVPIYSTNPLSSIYLQYLVSGKARQFFEMRGFEFLH